MDLRQAFYEAKFENAFHRAKGQEFQTLFQTLMELAYPANFQAIRAWGSQGDLKNDGFLESKKQIFQVYAPYSIRESETIAKIQQDFDGAKTNWNGYFSEWVFVHNAVDGLPPRVQKLLLDLATANPSIHVAAWGFRELLRIFRILSITDLEHWFGQAPTDEAAIRIGFADIQEILARVGGQDIPPTEPVRDVPRHKITANDLSESVATLLKAGMVKAPLVEELYLRWPDPTLGERNAQSFRAKYESLRGTLPPDAIFAELQTWIGGNNPQTPESQVAILAVMAYYFERCDIFEEPMEEGEDKV